MARTQRFKILKLFFVTLGSTLILALFLDFIFDKVFFPTLSETSNIGKMKRMIEESHPKEIPIYGSSIARRSYIPDTIGFNTFNYGMAGNLYNAIHAYLQIELEKEKSTPIIIDFDAHTFFYDENLLLHRSSYVPFLQNQHIIGMLKDYDYYSWHLLIPGMRYYGSYNDYLRQGLKPFFEPGELDNKGGVFFPSNPLIYAQFRRKRLEMQQRYEGLEFKKTETPKLFTSEENMVFDWLNALLNFHNDSTQVANFEKLVTDNPNRTFILCYSPQNPIKLAGMRNKEECQVFLKNLTERHNNIIALNYSEIGFPESLYKDSGHMNVDGARAYSALLKRDLTRILNDSFPADSSYFEIRQLPSGGI